MRASDVVVVGSGMAGLTAALAASARGRSVTLAARGAGALAIGGGCVDLLGYVNGRVVRGNPLDSIGLLPEGHPYRIIGAQAVRDALDFFEDVCRRHDLPMSNEGGENVWIPTILGTFRPTWLCLASQDRRLLAQAEKIAAVGVRSLKDCHAGMVVRMLGRQKNLQGKPIVSLELPSPFGATHRNITPLDLARFVDTEQGEEWLRRGLEPHASSGTAFLLPPVLGIVRTREIWNRLSEGLGCRIMEMASTPPGVGGLRIRRVLTDALAEAGVAMAENVRAVRARVQGNRCLSIECEAPDRMRELRGESFIIAAGGFFGGGLLAEPGRAREALFGLELDAPELVEDWSTPNVFDAQPYACLGVRVNPRLNPLDAAGAVLWENVFFAGRSLAGYDFVAEKSGNGVALASGYHAAQQC